MSASPVSGRVTVVVPAYNRAGFILRTLESVRNQTYRDLEILVVDDASTDDTEGVVAGIPDERVRYVRHQENKGPSAARNTGICRATGEFVAFLDSDDEWVPDKLEMQMRCFSRDPSLGMVYSGWEWVREDGTTRIARAPDPDSGTIDRQPRWFYNIVQDLVVRTDLARQCLFDDEVRAYENLEWLIRLSGRAKWGFVPRILVRCHDHTSGRASDSGKAKLQGLEYVLSHYHPMLRGHRQVLHTLYLRAGALAFERWNRNARGHLVNAIKTSPWSLRAWAWFALTLKPGFWRNANDGPSP